MRNLTKLLVASIVLAVLLSAVFVGNAAEESVKAEPGSADQSKEGQKVYVVYVSGGLMVDENAVLQPLDNIRHQGVECLAGTYVRRGYWSSGKRVYIPVNKIRYIIEFNSLEEYEKALGKYTETQTKQIKDYYRPGR